MALFDENMVVGKSKYLVTLYLYELKQTSDRVISGGSSDFAMKDISLNRYSCN